MTAKIKKTLTAVTTHAMQIPLNKLVPSPDNVRRTYREASIAELAASIDAHGLLQNLTVKAQLGKDGKVTGLFEVPAGGRRLAALNLLAKRKRIAKNAPIPCNVREDGIAKELSLVENAVRENLHPADQFEAFRALHEEHGFGAEEIAARFGVGARTVKERLKLGAVSPRLLALYRDGELTLEQIMAFTVSEDHARQEEVCESLSWNRTPEAIRKNLLTAHVAATDKRASFVGLEAYEAAGGVILRDLFAEDDGGYLADPALLDRLARDKLTAVAQTALAQGWKWADAQIDHPHGHGFKHLYPQEADLDAADSERLTALETELHTLETSYEDEEDASPEVVARREALEADIASLDAKRWVFSPEDKARAGAFVSIGQDGEPEIAFGLVRPEDETNDLSASSEDDEAADTETREQRHDETGEAAEARSGLSERLIADLTAYRTLALRDVLGQEPNIAIAALTHTLALQVFYPGEGSYSCLELTFRSQGLRGHAPGIDESEPMRRLRARHEGWAGILPRSASELWSFVRVQSVEARLDLLAHCTGLSVNAVRERGRSGDVQIHADELAVALTLDMRNHWTATRESYFERVPKALILEAVKEGLSAEAARHIENAKKAEMAEAAEALLRGTGWLPKLLRRPEHIAPEAAKTDVTAQAAE